MRPSEDVHERMVAPGFPEWPGTVSPLICFFGGAIKY
jgi:hypothetical protein